MFRESNRIIIVDNSQDDLNRIAHEFNLKGIGCKTILYDGFTFPEKPYSDVRIAFFDVNLSPSSSDEERFSILKDAMKSYISTDNGPFVLIFWTNKVEWKDGFIEYVNRNPKDEDIVRDRIKPFHISIIDKTAISEQNTLQKMLEKELGNNFVKLCMGFDNQLRDAANKAIGNLLSIIPLDKKWGDLSNFEDKFKRIFTKIAISSWGLQNAKDNPDGAINDAILPVIANSFQYENLWKQYLGGFMQNLQNDKTLLEKENMSLLKLNSFFLIDESIDSAQMRGAVVKLKKELFPNYFNTEFECWKKREFGESTKIKDAYPIAVEISAACDYCQQKYRNCKYLVGIASNQEIPNKNRNNVMIMESCMYKSDLISIGLDYNFIFTDYNPSIIDSVLWGFKKEIVDMIGNRYANHISRIGITTFK